MAAGIGSSISGLLVAKLQQCDLFFYGIDLLNTLGNLYLTAAPSTL